MELTIDDLLNALISDSNIGMWEHSLPNTKETWKRIGTKDSFEELGLGSSELEKFLVDWISENPYNNI